jgi:hypothetical protein
LIYRISNVFRVIQQKSCLWQNVGYSINQVWFSNGWENRSTIVMKVN